MIGQIYKKINPKLMKPKSKLLIIELLSGYHTEITKENIMSAGYGENLVVAVLAELKRAGLLILEKMRDLKGCFTAFRYHLKSVFKPVEEVVLKEPESTALPYIQWWNKVALESGIFEPLPENKAPLFESDIKRFESIATFDEYKKMVTALMKLPYFRGENSSGFLLRFHFILDPKKVKRYYQGGYFDQTKPPLKSIKKEKPGIKKATIEKETIEPVEKRVTPDRERDFECEIALKQLLDQRFPEFSYIFRQIDIAIYPEEEEVLITGIPPLLERLRSNRFDIKIEKILTTLTKKIFKILISGIESG